MTNTFFITSNSFKDGEIIKNIYACPPKGSPHTYTTSIYALSRRLDNMDNETPWTRMKFENLFNSDILNAAGITGIYSSS